MALNFYKEKNKMEALLKIGYWILFYIISAFVMYLIYTIKKGIKEFNRQWLNLNGESE